MSPRPPSEAGAGAPASTAQGLRETWRMLGLPLPPEGLADQDVAMLRVLLDVARDARVDPAAVARPIGHHASRLATWQVLGLVEGLTAHLPPEAAAAAARRVVRDHGPALESLMLEVWRRHLAAVFDWRLDRASEQAYDLELSVGFSDLVDYTVLTAGLEGRALAALVRTFERVCVETVSDHGGRIVKTLGDEVLYVADEPETALRIGLALRDRAATSGVLPQVRVGVATGAVTAVLGDVYGVTVNRASRLTKAAEPGEVLVDETTRARGSAHVELQPRGPVELAGLGQVLCWRAVAS